ncbi:protein SHORTAGE IN CHIASMATA 1 [Rutidosis leptorrhynchoides]|uniref:protein SHORTAGE IN CHIASMATA 1 n=1 Tax=Rutidosis leptorrhynchoides TaxID=125765 RepID=UPI003A9957EE
MRTRFLNDYFNTSAASRSLQTLEFLRFPPPEFPSTHPFNFDNITCFDQLAPLNITYEFDPLPVNEALSKFLADVIPQHIHTDINQQDASEVISEEKINDNLDGAANTIFEVIEFETPGLHIGLENSCSLLEEKMQLFFDFADANVSTEQLDFSLGVNQLTDLNKLIFDVEDLNIEVQDEPVSDILEDASLVKRQISSNLRTFPLFEVDETSLEINSCIPEIKHVIFESDEPEQWMQRDESACDSKELLHSLEFDLLEHLLGRQIEIVFPEFSLEDDIVNVIEHKLTEKVCLISSPVEFEQHEFFDVNTSHFSEVFFVTELINEVEHCEQMFGDTTISTFNSLIVEHELILRDDSFRSLPVPIISDHVKVLSVQAAVEEVLLKVKLQPSLTSDDIYLDWHLLDEDFCGDSITTKKIFEDIDSYHINTETDLCDNRMMVLEFIMSDACSYEKPTKENTEVLNIEKSGDLTDPACHDGNASTTLNDPRHKIANREDHLLDDKVNKAHQDVNSMLQFDDLDFFLQPLEATGIKKQKAADKKIETDYALPFVSENSPIKAHDSSQKQQKRFGNEFPTRGDFQSTSLVNESSERSGSLHSTHDVPQLRVVMESKRVNANTPSLPDAIIIVNTQNVDKEMIISRRSTYQKILALEKEGVQVVERDLNLPVDIILSPAMCLVLYDINNIKRKTSSSDRVSSSLSSCVEEIAANVLTSLSFAFSCCMLIFEGEVSFVTGVIESSDELYVAAASLGVDFQLFCSYSPETTDELILNCIAHAAKETRGLFPKMPESETLGEAFLTAFPSINPLSAHAILCSVTTLAEFFEMSHKQRVLAVQKYLVTDARIALFSTLCKLGEREDSRSGTTDCCSSVSSGHDSGNRRDQKKRKYVESPETKPIPMDELFQFDQNNDVKWDIPKTVDSHSFWNLENEEISYDIVKSNKAFDEIYFGQSQRSDPHMMVNCSNFTETSFGQSKKMHMPIVDKLVIQTKDSKGLPRGYKGEVIDIDDVAGQDFSFVNPKKLSSGWCSLPSFPTAAEINSDFNSWIPTKDNGNSSREVTPLNSHTYVTPLEECSVVNSPVPSYGRTPLTKAIYSAQPPKGSPWTIDFLNRMKEKSRMRQQSMPNISSAPCFGYRENSSKFRKRKSPSILDFYRYKRSNTEQSMEHKGKNVPTQPSQSSKATKSLPFPLQSWTPIDKRAKRKLTFTSNGGKGQSKLTWSDKTY